MHLASRFLQARVLFVFGAVVGTVVAVGSDAGAGSCGGGEGYIAYANAGTQYGARAGGNEPGLLALDTNPECAFVRSVVIQVDLTNYTEIGLFMDPNDQLDQCQAFTEPHLLAFARVGNTFKCKQNPPSLTPDQWYHVRVENPDHNNRMNYYLGATSQGYHTVTFNQAEVKSFDERRISSDSLRANLSGLDYMGSADDWNSWPNMTNGKAGFFGTWVFCEDSNTHYRVVSTQC